MAQENVANASVTLQRISFRKANLVASLVRGERVDNALAILKNTPWKTNRILIKLINSAIANGVNNHGMNAEKMVIAKLVVEQGPTLKRFQPQSKGRANRILKRTSNFKITIAEG